MFPKRLLGVAVTLAAFFLALGPVSARAAKPPARATHASPPTASSKKKPAKKRRKSSRQSSQKAPTADRITEIQSALARGGYYGGDLTGKWDSNTVAALQKFQSSNGLDSNGKLDALSLQKLGLGSDIAGVSAPKPVTPPGSAGPVSSLSPPASMSAASASAMSPSSAISSVSAADASVSASNSTPR